MPGDVIRVILADDHAVVRAGLKAVLSPAKDISVIGEAANGKEAVALAERFNPDVVIMDLSMPDMDGATATKTILARQTNTRILVLTMHAEEEYLLPLLEAGASGYLVKSAADLELVAAVRAVAHGDPYVSSSASHVLIKGLTRKDPAQADHDRYNALTQRERDVLRLVAQG
jgi:DNA-binding NarL/FixJ family response regulator